MSTITADVKKLVSRTALAFGGAVLGNALAYTLGRNDLQSLD
jgi:hypothetical protein